MIFSSFSTEFSETKFIWLIASIQFINILDFMMVMPLGPDFASALQIHPNQLGWIGGSYTAAAAIAGLFAAQFLDQLERKKALIITLLGLFLMTGLGALAFNFYSLLTTRILAGSFGGPATALTMAMVADVIPSEKRGNALGKIMGAFSVAAIIGVPFGLELSQWFHWRMPFLTIAVAGMIITGFAHLLLPSFTSHLQTNQGQWFNARKIQQILTNKLYVLSLLTNASAMMAGFMIIPNIAAYVQSNLHYPREKLGTLYMAGGLVTFFTLRLVGPLIDRIPIFYTTALAALLVCSALWIGFIHEPPSQLLLIIFMIFMCGMSMRNVSMHTLASKVPSLYDRASYMAVMSSVQHSASAIGAFLASMILSTSHNATLKHMPLVASLAMGITLIHPFLSTWVEHLTEKRNITAGN